MPIGSNQETIHEFTYKNEILSEINNTQEILEVIFPIILKLIDQYQQKYASLLAKYTTGTYQKGYFRGGSNIYIIILYCVRIILLFPQYSKF